MDYGLSFFPSLLYSYVTLNDSWVVGIRDMRVGILSDTHLTRVTKELEDIYDTYLSQVDVILHAGDFVSEDIVGFLSRKDFHGVCGNMDPMELKQRLPAKKVIEMGTFRLGLIHGWGYSGDLEERIRGEFNQIDAIVYGHSHRPVNHIRDNVLFFNPGTALGYSSSRGHSLGVLEVEDKIRGEFIQL
jgi:putative phosphoesterase